MKMLNKKIFNRYLYQEGGVPDNVNSNLFVREEIIET